LPPAAIETIRVWIASGAAFDGGKPSESLAMVMPPRTDASPPKAYAHAIPVAALAFTPDGKQLVVGGYHELLVFDASEGMLLRRIGNLGQRIFAISFLGDASTLAVASGEPGRDGDVRLVDFEKAAVTKVFARTVDVVLDIAPRPQGDQVAVAAADGIVRIVDVASGAEVRAIASHADWVNAVAWSDDGTKLASASRDRSVKVYDAESGDLLANYQDHGEPVRGVAFAPDGTQVLTVGADKKLHRWDIDTAKKVAGVDLQGEGCKLARTADTVFVSSADTLLRSIDLTKNAVARTF
jgi:WD40 repeat protein